MTDLHLSKDDRNLVIETTAHYIQEANRLFGLALAPLPIHFDVFGSAWGYYVRKGNQRWFRYNPLLFARHPKEGLSDTIPHEVAHYVVDLRYPKRRCKPHGREWREIMYGFGITNPRATHRTSLEGIPVRRQQRYIYYCRCGETTLSATRHNRIQRKGTRYLCRRCGAALTPTPPG